MPMHVMILALARITLICLPAMLVAVYLVEPLLRPYLGHTGLWAANALCLFAAMLIKGVIVSVRR